MYKALKYIPALPKLEDNTKKNLLVGGLILGALYYGKKWLDEKIKSDADSQVADKPEAAQAKALRAAMNRSGVSWLMWTDGTNSEAIYKIAEQITDYKAVSEFYKSQNQGASLEDDLISEISADGFQKFLALASQGKTGEKKYAKVRTDVPAGHWVITTAQANVRRTPKKEPGWMPGSNIVREVSTNYALGASTGKFAYDEKNDVTFIEFYTLDTKKQKHFFFVALSQVKFMTNADWKALQNTPNKIPLQLLAGTGANQQMQLVSARPCLIYSEENKALYTAPANLILGFPVLELTTGSATRVKFLTVQGFTRWVNKADTKTIER